MDWPLVRLDSLYNIARGGSPRPINKFITEEPGGINWIKIGDATASGKYIYETKQKIISEGIQRSRLVNEGDFILSNSMSFGRPYIMATSGCIHDGWLVLSPKNEQVVQDFLYHILGSPFVFKQFDSLAAGSTVRNLNISLVSGVKIPLLPIPEQKRIVTILDQAFADIDQVRVKTEQNLKNAHELFESYLQQVFNPSADGWVKTNLGAVAEFKNGLNFSQNSKGELLKIVGVKNFKANFMVPFEQLDTVQIDGELSEGYELKENDIITVRSNGNKRLIGRCLLMGKVNTKTSYSGFTIRIRLIDKNINSEFLANYMKSASTHELLINSGEGANISNLNQKILTALPIAYPSYEQQCSGQVFLKRI